MMALLSPQEGLPEGWGEQVYYGQTTVHPVGLAAVITLGILMIIAPRRRAMLPFLLLACFVSPAQRVVIATLDFNFIRLMVIFGMLRVFARGEFKGLRMTGVDVLLVAWVAVGSAVYVIRAGDMAAIVNRAGQAYDALGMYFLFRLIPLGANNVSWVTDQQPRIDEIVPTPQRLIPLQIGAEDYKLDLTLFLGGCTALRHR
jgi:hypothetical protein